MRARSVIGAGFGDEGKGLIVDYLCAKQGAGMVVRFNGGAQAGHTVVAPDGRRHVFKHFGSGSLLGVPTFLSQFFVLNPLLFLKELDDLHKIGVHPVVYAHPNCLVTTFADMIINQRLEDARGAARHGSCGVGVNETVERSQVPELNITVADLWNSANILDRLVQICGKYAEFRTGSPIGTPDLMIHAFIAAAWKFTQLVHPLGIGQCKDPVFEGAQGLLLDSENKQFFPHVTRSRTGMHNVRILCEQAKITDIEIYYVSRTYLTRHGAGPLPGEDAAMKFEDNTNGENRYQGPLRFAPLDRTALRERMDQDCNGVPHKLALTHCDQIPSTSASVPMADLRAHGPTRNDVDDSVFASVPFRSIA